MDNTEPELAHRDDAPQIPSWINAIKDAGARKAATQLFHEHEAIKRTNESNLKFISTLRSKDTVQQERIDRLQRDYVLVLASGGGGLAIIGLTVLLIKILPLLGTAAAGFFGVLLGRACFPALAHILSRSLERIRA